MSNIPEDLVQPDFTEMVDHGHIGVFENFLRWEFCDKVVEAFEFWYNKKHIKTSEDINKWGDGTTQFPQGGMGRKDHQLYMEVADATYAMEINQAVGAAFEIYAKKYKGIIDAADPVSSWTCKIQRTDPGGGYHVWHCENGVKILSQDRWTIMKSLSRDIAEE